MIFLSDDESDSFTVLGGKCSLTQRTAELKIGFQGGGSVCECSRQIRNKADFAFDGIQQFLSFAGRGFRRNLIDA